MSCIPFYYEFMTFIPLAGSARKRSFPTQNSHMFSAQSILEINEFLH